MPHNDLHLTIEQLSELIDDQVTQEERAHIEEHLQHCAQCQEEFTNLRQVVTMLHALPRPELPRSFALPAGTKVIPLKTAAANRSSTLRSAGRAISLLAAVVGIALLISSLSGLPAGGATSATGLSGSSSATSHSSQPFSPSSRTGTPSATANSLHPTATPQSAPLPPTQSPSLLDLSTSSGRAIFGIVLLVLGLAGALILWRRRYSLP